MSLKTRFFLLALLLVTLASAAAWIGFRHIAESIIEQWGQRVVQIQVRYDSARLQQSLEREIALARQMADSNVLRRWAREPNRAELKEEAIREMESFRRNFREMNYFVVLADSGAYYHNNGDDEFADTPLRYHLSRDNPDDAWFYQLMDQDIEFHLNVNRDRVLGVTKLWVNILMRDGDRILGMVGTGLALNTLLREIVDINQPGITTMFVDAHGAIQLYRDQEFIDFASIVKPEGEKNTIDLLLDASGDRDRLRRMMSQLHQRNDPEGVVLTDFVSRNGQRHLAGIAFLPELGWYEISFVDLNEIMPVRHFGSVAAVFAFTLTITLILFHLALKRLILNPLAALETAIVRVRDGDLRTARLPEARGEIGRLIQHFNAMADAIRTHTRELESKVRERTQALERLARTDALTGLRNRRGMTELLHQEIGRTRRHHTPFGLIWLDIDNFKELNDRDGHAAGDRALSRVARIIGENIRPYDRAARWGGDEFLVLLAPCDTSSLERAGERIRAAMEQEGVGTGNGLTVSIGASLALPGDDLETVLQRADEALYRAKSAGRNVFQMARPAAGQTTHSA